MCHSHALVVNVWNRPMLMWNVAVFEGLLQMCDVPENRPSCCQYCPLAQPWPATVASELLCASFICGMACRDSVKQSRRQRESISAGCQRASQILSPNSNDAGVH